MKMKIKPAYLGIFTALAMILSYIESLFPLFFGMPGIKLGLANSLSLMILYLMNAQAAFVVLIIRIVLSGILFANAFSILYSLSGGLLSMAVMILLKKKSGLSIVGVSIAGAIAHNTGQLIAAAVIASNAGMFYYAPVLLASGLVTGLVIGLLSAELVKRLPKLWAGQ